MTSLDVASATSSLHTPVPVTKRELLWSGGTIEIQVPAICREGAFEKISFIQFARHVKGGLVNIFVQADNPTKYCGKIITAKVDVKKQYREDGRSFLYVDLRPTNGPATHKLVVEPRLDLSTTSRKAVFQAETPRPLEGIIVILEMKAIKQKKGHG